MKKLDTKEVLFKQRLDHENNWLDFCLRSWIKDLNSNSKSDNAVLELYWDKHSENCLKLRTQGKISFLRFKKSEKLRSMFDLFVKSLPEEIAALSHKASQDFQGTVFDSFAKSLYNYIYLGTPFLPLIGLHTMPRRSIPNNFQFIAADQERENIQASSKQLRANISHSDWENFLLKKTNIAGVVEYFYNYLLPGIWLDKNQKTEETFQIKSTALDFYNLVMQKGIYSSGAQFVSPMYALKTFSNNITQLDEDDSRILVTRNARLRTSAKLKSLFLSPIHDKLNSISDVSKIKASLYSESEIFEIESKIEKTIVNQFKLYFYDMGMDKHYSEKIMKESSFLKILQEHPDLRIPFLKDLQFIFLESEEQKAWIQSCEEQKEQILKDAELQRIIALIDYLAHSVTRFHTKEPGTLPCLEDWIKSPSVDSLINDFLKK